MTTEANTIATPDMISADTYNADVQAKAARYAISLFLGRVKYANADAATLAEAKAAAKMQVDHPAVVSKPMIVASDEAGNQSVVGGKASKAKKPAAKSPMAKAPKAAMRAKAKALNAGPTAAEAEKPAKAAAPAKEAKPLGKRAQAEADAAAGKLPAAPHFSAATHSRFRWKLDELVALVKKGGIAACALSRSTRFPPRPRGWTNTGPHGDRLEAKAAKKAARRRPLLEI